MLRWVGRSSTHDSKLEVTESHPREREAGTAPGCTELWPRLQCCRGAAFQAVGRTTAISVGARWLHVHPNCQNGLLIETRRGWVALFSRHPRPPYSAVGNPTRKKASVDIRGLGGCHDLPPSPLPSYSGCCSQPAWGAGVAGDLPAAEYLVRGKLPLIQVELRPFLKGLGRGAGERQL